MKTVNCAMHTRTVSSTTSDKCKIIKSNQIKTKNANGQLNQYNKCITYVNA